MKTFLHLEFGQLSQLLGSIEDELSALEETEREGRGEGEREGGRGGRRRWRGRRYRGGDSGQQQTA